MNIHIELVRTALTDIDLVEDDEDVVIRRRYSGRRMYGATCLGIDLPGRAAAFAAIGALCVHLAEHGEDWQELAWSAATDQMGLGMVLYFPEVHLTEETR